MTKKDKLLKKTEESPRNLRFKEFITLLEQNNFVYDRTDGSHHQYYHTITGRTLSIQPTRNGTAKYYQVKQFLSFFKEGKEEEN